MTNELTMTREKCIEVLDRYERSLTTVSYHKKDQEMVHHLLGMIPRMREMLWNSTPRTEKFMRWVGFMQGVLWQRGLFTLEELKEHNKQ